MAVVCGPDVNVDSHKSIDVVIIWDVSQVLNRPISCILSLHEVFVAVFFQVKHAWKFKSVVVFLIHQGIEREGDSLKVDN